MKWIVNIKGGPNQTSWEISVLRDDNTHGIASYGWCDGKHKILIGHNGGPCNDIATPRVWDGLLDLANTIAQEMNEGER